MLKTVEQYLDKLAKVDWRDANSDTLKGVTESGSKVEFSLEVKLANSYHDLDNMPTQVVARIKINGHYVSSWGATEPKDNTELVKFFRERQAKAQNKFYNLQSSYEKLAKEEFEQM